MNGVWRRWTGTRVMRSAAVEFGPPPGARYAVLLGRPLSDQDLAEYGPGFAARDRLTGDAARDRVIAYRARTERGALAGRAIRRHLRTLEVAR